VANRKGGKSDSGAEQSGESVVCEAKEFTAWKSRSEFDVDASRTHGDMGGNLKEFSPDGPGGGFCQFSALQCNGAGGSNEQVSEGCGRRCEYVVIWPV
jgi:hypothetical protein